ncbi:hypothetical protein C0992_001273 [Termitomyces sp. T32_za158]|nr:hypothetical protein C0992_001273 [Termitomyces sp. T32_za158]
MARFEAYCLSNVEGMIDRHISTTAELKTKLKDLINTSLQETVCGKVHMSYVGFDEKFTVPYGVVIEKWPIQRFIPPSELTRPEVDVLLGAWSSGTTSFRRMEQEEWDKWLADRGAAAGRRHSKIKHVFFSQLVNINTTDASSLDTSPDNATATSSMDDTSPDNPATINSSGSMSPDNDADTALSPGLTAPSDDTIATSSSTTSHNTIAASTSNSQAQSLVDRTNLTHTTQSIFINSVPGAMATSSKKRKQRSDAGKKRGSRKKALP